MDKAWIHLPSRLVPEYEEGVQKFIAQARNYAKTREVILCPCKRCKNKKYMKFDEVYDHLIINGIDPSYTIWVFHGETYTPQAVEEKMRVIEECPPESLNTTNIADDAISLVFGKEARGRVRGMGFGVTPSKVGACVQQNRTIKQIQSMMNNVQQEMQEMRSIFLQIMKQQNDQEQVASGGISSGIGNDIGSSSDVNGAKKIGNVNNVMQNVAIAQTTFKNVNTEGIHDNSKCKLLHWCGDEVVAEGRVASTDPKAKVHHIPLGGSCWKVWVDKVLVEKVDLIRPNDEMLYLNDAIGSTVAWMSKLIVLCD